MSHSHNSTLIHCVFTTKHRDASLTPDIRPRIYEYIGGIVRHLGCTMLAIGGTADHIHLLLSLTPTVALANAMMKIKANSARWIHDTFPAHHTFAWQDGYGAFSIGVSQRVTTVAYINRQEQHHRRIDFAAEWNAILKKHGLDR
jgi:REP element-mobilizing transposase RayT